MTRSSIGRNLTACAAALAIAGCLRGPVDRAHAGEAGGAAKAPLVVVTPFPAEAVDAQMELRRLQSQLLQARAERDAALAQLHEALASERALEARLNASSPPASSKTSPTPSPVPARRVQIFKSLNTAPTP